MPCNSQTSFKGRYSVHFCRRSVMFLITINEELLDLCGTNIMNHSREFVLIDDLINTFTVNNDLALVDNKSFNHSLTNSSSGLIDGIPDYLVDPNILLFRRVIHCIDLYGIPIISVVGILGNMACFLVFMATYLRTMSSSVYLAALSLCDSVFLLTTLFSWMDNVNVDIYHRQGWCQVLTYLGYVTSFQDVWYVVSFTVERYIAVCFPLKRQGMCTPKRAKIVVISLAILGIILFNYALWTTEVGWYYERPFCSPKVEYFKLVLALSNVDTLITLIIPTVAIITCNIRIGYAVAQFYRNRLHMEGNSSVVSIGENSSSNDRTVLYTNSSQSRLQLKVTKMLLVVSSVFLICHMPSHGFRVYAFIMSHAVPGYTPSHLTLLIQKLFQYVYIMNFGLNFFLYNVSGKTFRKALVRFVGITRGRISHFMSTRYTSIRTRHRNRTKTHTDVILRLNSLEQHKCLHHHDEMPCAVCAKYS